MIEAYLLEDVDEEEQINIDLHLYQFNDFSIQELIVFDFDGVRHIFNLLGNPPEDDPGGFECGGINE